MKRNRRVAAAATVFAVGLGLVGCSSDSSTDDSTTAASTGGSGEPVEITFWSWLPGFADVVTAFNESQDDIEVTFEETASGGAGGYAQLSAALEAGNAPDVATIEYPSLPGYAAAGDLTAIDSVLDGDVLEPYSDGLESLVTLGDSVWALPYDAPIQVYYYRTDLFEQAGIEAPTTWDEFEAAARTYKETFPDGYIASFFPNEPLLMSAMAWQNGASWFDTADDSWTISIDDDATTEVGDYWQRLIDEDLIKVEQAYSDEWANSLSTGTVSGTLGANWLATSVISRTEGQEGSWAVAPIPTPDGEPASGMWGGSTFAVTKDAENAEAAATFAQWLTTSEEAVAARGSVGAAVLADPELTKVAAEAFDASHFGGQDVYEVFDAASESIVPGWTWGPTMTGLVTQMQDDLGKVTSGSTVNDAFASAQSKAVSEAESLGLSVSK
ncbi:sugar ABC transporter substrate-binding protein [Cellulomonas sp. NPDC089187]|uniref:ABC transporter substrate-binding protein n=1 Tax=Cellulomonas sp. NPDC089187 TaxID=3154970 RepID=UPI00341B7CAD